MRDINEKRKQKELSNAISLGFLDPCMDEKEKNDRRAYLWIDLQPELPKSDLLASGSSREFLFRVLTTAHPWGYKTNDKAETLGVDKIRKALEKYGKKEDGRYLRPECLFEAWPQESNMAIPFSWLIHAVILEARTGYSLWERVLENCERYKGKTWADSAAELIKNHFSDPNEHLELIEKGLGYAKSNCVVALEVPPEILIKETTRMVNTNNEETEADTTISKIEHLFQRLNSGGTELRGDELAFSMIKAYWPRIEASFEAIKDVNGAHLQPMSGSSLAMLSARAALFVEDKPPAPLSINRIRRISYEPKNKQEKKILEEYWGLDTLEINNISDLHLNLLQIDQWLLYDGTKNDFGLPPVMRTSLAQDVPDVFLLLLYIAQKVRNEKMEVEEISVLRKRLIGLSTALHWFGDKHRVDTIERIYKKMSVPNNRLTPDSFNSALLYDENEMENNRRGVLKILTPCALADLIPEPNSKDENLHKWDLWKLIIKGS